MNKWIRQVHRWLSIAFTLGSIANIVALAVAGPSQDKPAVWLGFVALVPLILLMISGLSLFALPYVSKARGAERGARLSTSP